MVAREGWYSCISFRLSHSQPTHALPWCSDWKLLCSMAQCGTGESQHLLCILNSFLEAS